MANKTLSASVKLDTRDAESKLKRLSLLIANIDKAINGKSSGGKLEKTLGQQLRAAEKLRQEQLKTELAEERLANQKLKNLSIQNRITAQEEKSASSLTKTDLAAQKLVETNYKRWWQETMTTHAIGDQVAQMGAGDHAAQRLNTASAKRARTEYEVWWQTQLANQEYRKAHPLVTKIADKLGVNKAKTQEWAVKQSQLLNGFKGTQSTLGSIGSKLKSIIGMYAGIQGLKLMVNTSDTITSAKNRLNALDGGSPEPTEQTLDKIYAASQRARTGFSQMMAGASKSMTIAGDAFQGNIDNAIRFEEIMAKSYSIAGASAEEQSNSMYQLRQALGSGILQGDELRSVREQAPLMYKEIEKFAQGVLQSEESLKDLAAQGVITSDIVVAAVMNAGGKIDDKFEDTSMTFAQAWSRIKNVALQVYRTISEKLEGLLNSDRGKKAIDGICNAVVVLGNIVGDVIGFIISIISWCVDNWNWFKYVVIGVLVTIISYELACLAIKIAIHAYEMWMWLLEYWAILLIIGAIGGLLLTFIMWQNGAIDTCDAVAVAVVLLGIIIMAVIAIVTGGISLIPIAIAAVIAFIVAKTDWVLGIIYSALAFIYNLVAGVVDGILQYLYQMISPILSLVEWIYNCFNGGFNSIGDACANLVGQMISWFLSLGKVVTKIIDAIFGTNWTDGLESLRQSVTSWGKNEKAITLTQDAPTLNSLTKGKLPDRISYGDAWSTGVSHGNAVKDKINTWGAQFQDSQGLLDRFAKDGKLDAAELKKLEASGLNVDDPSKLLKNATLPNINDPALAVDKSYDPSGADDDIAKALKEISGDTGDISNSIKVEDEDLEYLRKLADLEWRNEFTTAEIKVDMTNNNSITSERDWEGMLTYLRDTLREEMDVVANGVHGN